MSTLRKQESGMTIVEVLVAALILTIAVMATFGVLSAATKNTERAKATQVALDRAQQEVEKLRTLTNEELALTTTPGSSTSDLSPGYRVNASNATYALNRSPRGSYQPMVINTVTSLYGGGVVKGGVVNPGPISFSSGSVHGWVYRYVVWRNDEKCPEASCPGTQDYKQIVVAVKLKTPVSQPGERGYVEVQSNFVDPQDSPEKDPVPGANGVVTAQQFFLSDTTCSSSSETAREDITGDHLLHNTMGKCSEGLQNGTTLGAPDTLLLGGPPDPAPEDESDPLRYDYSNDFYLEPTPDTDKGVQIRLGDTSGCFYTPTGTTNPQAQVHRWVTDPMAAEFKLSGKVTLKFFTRTLNDVPYKGGICVYLFVRDKGETTDTMLADQSTGASYWKYSPGGTGYWPREKWTEVGVPMTLSSSSLAAVPKEARLGLAITVDPAKTDADAIPIMYDHPNEPSRLEVETTTPIDGG
jgi:type II secretory pathway pseudopilin PulG